MIFMSSLEDGKLPCSAHLIDGSFAVMCSAGAFHAEKVFKQSTLSNHSQKRRAAKKMESISLPPAPTKLSEF